MIPTLSLHIYYQIFFIHPIINLKRSLRNYNNLSFSYFIFNLIFTSSGILRIGNFFPMFLELILNILRRILQPYIFLHF